MIGSLFFFSFHAITCCLSSSLFLYVYVNVFFMFICFYVKQVEMRKDVTKMTAENLSIVFSPTLRTDQETVRALITRFDELFDARRDAPQLPPTWPELPPGSTAA